MANPVVHSLNVTSAIPSRLEGQQFTISAAPKTDAWRKPPQTDAWSAPIVYNIVRLQSFRRARVTVSGPWTSLYDQGGLILALPYPEAGTSNNPIRRWIKAGIEMFNGQPHVSVVSADRSSDWSLLPINDTTSTVEYERETKTDGSRTSALWVYLIRGDGSRQNLREVTWAFDHADGEAWIGCYSAKPTADADDPSHMLEVTFKDFQLEYEA